MSCYVVQDRVGLRLLPENPYKVSFPPNVVERSTFEKLLVHSSVEQEPNTPQIKMRAPDDVFREYWDMTEFETEILAIFYLDSEKYLMATKAYDFSTEGPMSNTPVDIFQIGIGLGASSLYLAHNQREGNIVASDEELDLAKRLTEIGDLVGIPVLEHLIVNLSGYTTIQRDE